MDDKNELHKTSSIDTTVELDYEKAVGTRATTFNVPRSVTLQDDDDVVVRENRLRRQSSVGFRPQHIDAGSRVIGEFRYVAVQYFQG
jgi:hypothetical protein